MGHTVDASVVFREGGTADDCPSIKSDVWK